MSFEKRAHKAGFADIFVARPIFGIVLNLLIIIAGLAAFTSVDIREMPDVDRPVLSVRTTYEGAVPSTVDTEVTQVLEDALSALEGMSYIESTSSTGSSRITIDLSDGTDVNVAANQAREIVSALCVRCLTISKIPASAKATATPTRSFALRSWAMPASTRSPNLPKGRFTNAFP